MLRLVQYIENPVIDIKFFSQFQCPIVLLLLQYFFALCVSESNNGLVAQHHVSFQPVRKRK